MQYLQCAEKQNKKNAYYAFIKFNHITVYWMDTDTQGRNSIMNSFHQPINGWMKFLKRAIDCEAFEMYHYCTHIAKREG